MCMVCPHLRGWCIDFDQALSALFVLLEPAMRRRLKISVNTQGEWMWRGGCTDQCHGRVAFEPCQQGIQIMGRGGSVEDEVEAVGVRAIFSGLFDTATSAEPRRNASSFLSAEGGEQHYVCTHGLGDLHCHMAQTDLPLAQW